MVCLFPMTEFYSRVSFCRIPRPGMGTAASAVPRKIFCRRLPGCRQATFPIWTKLRPPQSTVEDAIGPDADGHVDEAGGRIRAGSVEKTFGSDRTARMPSPYRYGRR
jgi:hypothetical protein